MHVVLGCYPERFSDFVFSMENKGDFWDERLEGMGVDGGFWVEVQANLTVEFLLDGGRIGASLFPFSLAEVLYGFFGGCGLATVTGMEPSLFLLSETCFDGSLAGLSRSRAGEGC
ncbi:hypothetical protein I3760_09G195700 [Carya illinoinensis]|nr:hypothetical protein I3760_09G195700 [Carya illinoinensis]